MQYSFSVIAKIRTPFAEKFGIPRQAGLAREVKGEIIFEAEYRNPEALRGIEGFSHIWLLWCFSEHEEKSWHPTVRPPRLDGSTRVGVFATRSPFRPNPIGLSLVKLEEVDWEAADGPILRVSGADLMDDTPIFDMKPYIPYADCRPEAEATFVNEHEWPLLEVEIAPELLEKFPFDQRSALYEVLAQDPRPAYHKDPERIYGLSFAGQNIKFTVRGNFLQVTKLSPL